MENTFFSSSSSLKISPRASSLARQYNVDVNQVVPTGPEGRIIENDILRAIEERTKLQLEEKKAEEAKKASEAPVIEEKAPEATEETAAAPTEALTEEAPEEQTEATGEEIAEEISEAEETDNTKEEIEKTAEETDNGKITAEEPSEKVIDAIAENTPAEEDASEEVTEEAEATTSTEEPVSQESEEEPTEAAEEEPAEESEEIPSEEITEEASEPEKEETVETETEEPIVEEVKEELTAIAEETNTQTAIVAAPVTAITGEETKEEPKEKEEPAEKVFRSEEIYRHTDVIISQSENAPGATPITIEMSFDATAITDLREKIKANGEAMGIANVTINDMILFATTKILRKHKAMNAHFLGDKIRYFDGIHLGFAVDTDRGPQTLTLFDADRLSLASLSKIAGSLVRGVRAGGEVPEKNLRTGSFTVVNVGTLGVERFTPVLKTPQTGVLGVCALHKRVKSMEGEDMIYPCIPLALTFDPRAMSTANAAGFLRELCTALENFSLLLIK